MAASLPDSGDGDTLDPPARRRSQRGLDAGDHLSAHHVRLITKAGCQLCDAARADVARIAGELAVPWDEVDIASDEDLLWEYAEQVPVILLDGKQHGYWRVEEQRLRTALAR